MFKFIRHLFAPKPIILLPFPSIMLRCLVTPVAQGGRGLSQRHVAAQLHVKQPFVSKASRGLVPIPDELASRIQNLWLLTRPL